MFGVFFLGLLIVSAAWAFGGQIVGITALAACVIGAVVLWQKGLLD